MKIGILIDRLNVGGVEKIAIEEVRAFKKNGHDGILLVMSRNSVVENAFPDLLKDIPIEFLDDRLPKFFRFSFKIPFFSFFSFMHLSYPFLLPFVLKKKEYDFIISHNTYTSFTAITFSKINSIPYCVNIYDPISYIIKKAYPKGPIRWSRLFFILIGDFLDKLIMKYAITVFVQGDSHFNYLKKKIGNIKKLKLLPIGYSSSETIPEKRGEAILTVTAWKKGKGLEKLLYIISELSNVHLIVAGKWINSEYRKEIDFVIKKLNISEKVTILGEITEEKLNDLYKKARLNIIINNERGFGMSAIEGAANGCPFIIPFECGVSRYFENNKDGFFFEYENKKVLKEYIKNLLENERLAFSMGKSAWKKVKSKYSWDNHIKEILNNIK